ncbi:MAG: CDP-alcohol phosphatidyltransferase family protein, partial [Dethiobacteria bacterium]
RLIAVEEGRDIKVNIWGKIKTVAQIIMVIVLIIELAVKSGPSPPASWFQSLVYIYPECKVKQ